MEFAVCILFSASKLARRRLSPDLTQFAAHYRYYERRFGLRESSDEIEIERDAARNTSSAVEFGPGFTGYRIEACAFYPNTRGKRERERDDAREAQRRAR